MVKEKEQIGYEFKLYKQEMLLKERQMKSEQQRITGQLVQKGENEQVVQELRIKMQS